MNRKLNSNGMTLVEVLVVLVLGTIIALLAFNVLFSLFFNHKEKTVTSANVRDVADYYLESLTNKIYSMNESNVSNYVDTDGYYIEEGSKKTGFVKESGEVFLYIEGEKTQSPLPNIKIADFPLTKMEKENHNVYKITLTLEYNGKSKTFKKEVHSIP